MAACRTPAFTGADYPAPDGTCWRAYLDVGDLAASHVTAARILADGGTLRPVYNLGSGSGSSVREIMRAAYGDATAEVFLISAGVAVIALISVLLIKERPLRRTVDLQPAAAPGAGAAPGRAAGGRAKADAKADSTTPAPASGQNWKRIDLKFSRSASAPTLYGRSASPSKFAGSCGAVAK